MVNYSAVVVTLIKRIGVHREGDFSQLSSSLRNAVIASAQRTVAGVCLNWMRDERINGRVKDTRAEVAKGKDEAQPQKDALKHYRLMSEMPSILLFLCLPQSQMKTQVNSIVNRFTLLSVTVRGRSQLIHRLLASLSVHTLHGPYPSLTTAHLIHHFIVVTSIQLSDDTASKWERRGRKTPKVRPWVTEQNKAAAAAMAKLPREIQVILPTSYDVDVAAVIDEVARRLPPPGWVLDEGHVRSIISFGESWHMYGRAHRELFERSTCTSVSYHEFLIMVPKLIQLSAKVNHLRAVMAVRQNLDLFDFGVRTRQVKLCSSFARSAIGRTLSELELLVHMDKIVAARPLFLYEWTFLIVLVCCDEETWAATAYAAMQTALEAAARSRRETVRLSGKAAHEVSLFGEMTHEHRIVLFGVYAAALSDSRHHRKLFLKAVQCTKLLLYEFIRALESDTSRSLAHFDEKYRVRQILMIVTHADNKGVGVDDDSAGVDDLEEEEEVTDVRVDKDTRRASGDTSTAQHLTPLLLRAIDQHINASIEKSSTATARCTGASGEWSEHSAEESGFKMHGDGFMQCHVAESAVVYCWRVLNSARNLPEGFVDMALRYTSITSAFIEGQLRHFSSRSLNACTTPGAEQTNVQHVSESRPLRSCIDEGSEEEKTLSMLRKTLTLLGSLSDTTDVLSEEQRAATLALIIQHVRTLTVFVDSIQTADMLPVSLCRVASIFRHWYMLYKQHAQQGTSDADQSMRILVMAIFKLVQRLLQPQHRQQMASRSLGNNNIFRSSTTVVRLLDTALSITYAASLTCNEFPNVVECVQMTFETLVEVSQVPFALSRHDARRCHAERELHSSFLVSSLHILQQLSGLGSTDERYIPAAAAAIHAWSSVDRVRWISWQHRPAALSALAQMYRFFAERLTHSRHGREMCRQLLIVGFNMSLREGAFDDSASVPNDTYTYGTFKDRRVAILHNAVFTWRLICVAVSNPLAHVQFDKYIDGMLDFADRHFFITSDHSDMSLSSTPATAAELEECERVFASSVKSISARCICPATSRESLIVLCTTTVAIAVRELGFISTYLQTNRVSSSVTLVLARWIRLAELMWTVAKRYQRWVAPSAWVVAWREFHYVRVWMSRFNQVSAPLLEASYVTSKNVLLFCKMHHNNGKWVSFSPNSGKVPDHMRSEENTVVDVGTAAAVASNLLTVSDAMRMFTGMDHFADSELRLYAAELLERLCEEEEEHIFGVQGGHGAEQHNGQLENGDPLLASERYRRLRSCFLSVLYTCRYLKE